MSAHPETRFHCDRCHVDSVHPISTGPAMNRMAGPDNWLMLGLGADPSSPPQHLCPVCKEEFMRWFKAFEPFPADA